MMYLVGLAALRPPIGGISPAQGETHLAAANMTYTAWTAAWSPSIGGTSARARGDSLRGRKPNVLCETCRPQPLADANMTYLVGLAALSPSIGPKTIWVSGKSLGLPARADCS